MTETGVTQFKKALKKIKARKFRKAIELFEKTLNGNIEHQSIVLPETRVKINEWEFLDQISQCEKEIQNGSESFNAYYALVLLFKITDNHERRKKYLEKAISMDEEQAKAWREIGEVYLHQGKMKKALKHFFQAATLDAHDPLAYEGMALSYFYLDDPMNAITPLRKAIELDPDNPILLHRLAYVLTELGKLEEAKEHIIKCLKIDDSKIPYWDTYACILFLEENYREALEVFEKILSQNPKDSEVSWDILTQVYKVFGMHARAKITRNKLDFT
ncbi:MAG: tetratricopeptide repeat protein [Candidatus Heimdallarchaeota archaeon]|nr:tetratricopeptide repeat protein [Candidatus Heimdallarchaeota archaeon]